MIYMGFFSFENSEKLKHTLIHYQRNDEYHHATLKYYLNRSTRIENFDSFFKRSIFFQICAILYKILLSGY